MRAVRQVLGEASAGQVRLVDDSPRAQVSHHAGRDDRLAAGHRRRGQRIRLPEPDVHRIGKIPLDGTSVVGIEPLGFSGKRNGLALDAPIAGDGFAAAKVDRERLLTRRHRPGRLGGVDGPDDYPERVAAGDERTGSPPILDRVRHNRGVGPHFRATGHRRFVLSQGVPADVAVVHMPRIVVKYLGDDVALARDRSRLQPPGVADLREQPRLLATQRAAVGVDHVHALPGGRLGPMELRPANELPGGNGLGLVRLAVAVQVAGDRLHAGAVDTAVGRDLHVGHTG